MKNSAGHWRNNSAWRQELPDQLPAAGGDNAPLWPYLNKAKNLPFKILVSQETEKSGASTQ
jgi:hypothetical protein